MLRVADFFADSDTGRARRANEDAFFAHAPVFAVADGMGGAQAGEVASRTVVDCLRRGLPDDGSPEERLAALAEEANGLIHRKAAEDEQRAGMGTTLTAPTSTRTRCRSGMSATRAPTCSATESSSSSPTTT